MAALLIFHKKENDLLASEFSETIANLLAAENSKIVCLDASPSKKPFSASTQNNFVSDGSDLMLKEFRPKIFYPFNDEDGMIEAGEINKIKK